ncbi:hypothetical protein DAEQUDRAFT_447461 [Daedalea quercina L-15889]|uniref:Uncharacterized protein n=1 Tax=Daedalea quercina L-15889 TaxID=1314783 RepID=A0A165N5H5_9APHY|nr:hypothetical protein DAEQUDRAFT_447461 [Daedalea quercina L-15889]
MLDHMHALRACTYRCLRGTVNHDRIIDISCTPRAPRCTQHSLYPAPHWLSLPVSRAQGAVLRRAHSPDGMKAPEAKWSSVVERIWSARIGRGRMREWCELRMDGDGYLTFTSKYVRSKAPQLFWHYANESPGCDKEEPRCPSPSDVQPCNRRRKRWITYSYSQRVRDAHRYVKLMSQMAKLDIRR